MTYRIIGLLTGLLAASQTLAGHHEASEAIKPIVSAGQVVVVYEVPCSNAAAGLAILKDLVAYEGGASPVSYSSTLTQSTDAVIGAIDLHKSMAAMEQAFAWQAGDETWTAMQAKALAICDVTLDQIGTKIYTAQ